MADKSSAESWGYLTGFFGKNVLICVSIYFCSVVVAQYEDFSPRPILFSDGKTLAEVIFDEEDRMIHCKLHELEEDSDAEVIIRSSGLAVKYPSFRTMLELINNCTQLERPNVTDSIPTNSVEDESYMSWSPWSLWNGIMPGTKWCGIGDIAGSFEELGSQIEVDACCRAHDHCPVKLKAFRAGYGLINLSIYTKSHCDCDMEFFSCLKSTVNKMADMVGNFYFNVMRVQCIKEYRPYICLENRTDVGGFQQCMKWGVDPDNTKMQTTITQLKY